IAVARRVFLVLRGTRLHFRAGPVLARRPTRPGHGDRVGRRPAERARRRNRDAYDELGSPIEYAGTAAAPAGVPRGDAAFGLHRPPTGARGPALHAGHAGRGRRAGTEGPDRALS